MNLRKLPGKSLKHVRRGIKPFFWFLIGFFMAASALLSGIIIFFQYKYSDRVIPNVVIENEYLGGKTESEVEKIFDEKNEKLGGKILTFSEGEHIATISARDLEIGFNSKLIAKQAVDLGKSKNLLSSSFIILNSYINGKSQPGSYTFSEKKLQETLSEIDKEITVEPINALFNVEGNKVVAFQSSRDGKKIDYKNLNKTIKQRTPEIVLGENEKYSFAIPILTVEPDVTTEEANKFGIVEEIGRGKSYFVGSSANRIHNVSLAASRINGVLVSPGETFSFNKNLGDVSRYTGYKEAYVISGGRTVLGDGGGVCQVSTTLFRAILHSGMPVVERHAHSYRVSYYEQNSPIGMDATIYVPSVDLKFKNVTNNHILIQSFVNPTEESLTFVFYGKGDGRKVEITDPVFISSSPAPEPLYEDDPTLPKGEVKQVDFAAPGAVVRFSRTVTKDGEIVIEDTFTSSYTPWQAVFKRGTKET